MTNKKPVITEEVLLSVLKKNNPQLYQAVLKQESAKESGNQESMEEAARNLGIESGESLMLFKLISYIRGEKKLEELA